MKFHFRPDHPYPGAFSTAVIREVEVFVIPACHFAGEQGFEIEFDIFGWACVRGRVIGSEADAVALRLKFPGVEYIEDCECAVTG